MHVDVGITVVRVIPFSPTPETILFFTSFPLL